MAPSAVANGSHPAISNGLPQQTGEPPVSTLAAQLVDNLTRGTQQSKHQYREDFEQLLRIFETDSQEERYVDDPEAREESIKLIDVVVKAGLDVLFREDPFDDRIILVRQALRSLAVIELTIRRNSELLHTATGRDEADKRFHGPLYLWLLPKLLAIVICETDEKFCFAVLRTIALLLSERKMRAKLPRLHPIKHYMQGLIRDCIFLVEAASTAHSDRFRPTIIPSLRTVGEACPGHPQYLSIQSSSPLVIERVDQALMVAVCSLSALLSTFDTKGLTAKPRASSDAAWLLRYLLQVWDTVSPYLQQPESMLLAGPFLVIYLDTLRRYLPFVTKIGLESTIAPKVLIILARVTESLSFHLEPLLSQLSPHKHLCSVLLEVAVQCRESRSFSRVSSECLLPALGNVEQLPKASIDLLSATKLVFESSTLWRTGAAHELRGGLAIPFKDKDLQELYMKHFSVPGIAKANLGDERPPKRARLSDQKMVDQRPRTLPWLKGELCRLLSLQKPHFFPELHRIAAESYPQLSESAQCSVFLTVGQLACTSEATANDKLGEVAEKPESSRRNARCSICDGRRASAAQITVSECVVATQLLLMYESLLQLPQMQKRKRPTVLAMIALKRLLTHTKDSKCLDLTNSIHGQWCIKALQNPARDIRIAAGRLLPVFLRANLHRSLLQDNRRRTLECLRSISANGGALLQETSILAWGEVARVTEGDERNIVLLRLVEYLGHTNQIICGLAFDELRRVANHLCLTPMQLFAPYWRTIAPAVVIDLLKRPQVVQQLADILAVTVAGFLVFTQTYTTPFLVLTKKREVLQRIADSSNRSPKQLCMDHSNLAAILACILMQESEDIEGMIMALFSNISPEFGKIHYTDLLKAEQPLTAAELLKAATDEDDSGKQKVKLVEIGNSDMTDLASQAHQALRFLASVTHARQGSSRGTARRTDVVGPFFEDHVLGIMANLSDVINDGRDSQSISEKLRCLGAVREMLKLAKNYISNGLPQISACLQSAIENQDLCNQAFAAWAVMIGILGEDEVGPLVDPTFAIIAHHWNSFDEHIQAQAHDMISALFKAYPGMIRDTASTIPSLANIPLMTKFEDEVSKVKAQMDVKPHFQAFIQRCTNENTIVVIRALSELEVYLKAHQNFLHEAAVREQPDPVVSQLIRSVLDTSIRFKESSSIISVLAAQCLGLIGCLDPTRVEATLEQREVLVLSNFTKAEETKEFIVFFLREILVKVFLSTTNPRAQGFLAYAMQELLMFAEFDKSVTVRSRDSHYSANYHRWMELPESVRNTLTPFLTSKYCITPAVQQPTCSFPLYRSTMTHAQWLRALAYDLLRNCAGENARVLFPVLSRIVRFQDISIPTFLLPFVALNVIVGGTAQQVSDIETELQHVLSHPLPENDVAAKDNLILCSQNVFQILDYLSRWMQEKKKETNAKSATARGPRSTMEADIEMAVAQIQSVDRVLNLMIPAEIISRRAVECKSYARALFHWEDYIRQQKEIASANREKTDFEPLYERLQDIYTQIDEPDGIEGISANLQVLNIDQQVFEHRKAGRWTAAQSWYEMLLSERPDDVSVQYNLLISLKESGQHDVLLNQVDGFERSQASTSMALPFVAEAAWVTGKWNHLKIHLEKYQDAALGDFNVGVGRALLALEDDDGERFLDALHILRQDTAKSLTKSNTISLQTCHDAMLKLHAIAEIELLSGQAPGSMPDKPTMMSTLNQRLGVMGAFLSDKQYLLGIRRAAMQLSKRKDITFMDVSSAWLISAKLARKASLTHRAFNAVLHASQLGDESATLEHSRLLWREGQHRKAIRSLEGAIAANIFRSHNYVQPEDSMAPTDANKASEQNLLTARAHLLLAKWIDYAGQTQSDAIIQQYRAAVSCYSKWEKGHYYLGKHYNKLLESEKAKPPAKQAQTFITGETAKLVIENYLRAMSMGAKYMHQTLPRILTLWLELGSEAEQPLDPVYGNDESFRSHITAQRRKMLTAIHTQLKKYIDRLPAFVFYTALSQIVARICHPHLTVYSHLVDIVVKVVSQHPQQALWTLLAVVKSSSRDRAARGHTCMGKLMEHAKKARSDSLDLRALITQSQKLSDQLLKVCEGELKGKSSNVSITKDLGFNHKSAPCKIVIPLESTLTASLPTVTDNVRMKAHKAFSKEIITISSFLDDVLVLNSLQKPRRISIRGSDGHVYALLCKPKDDLRKDQRLMEFNAMINRSLKKDAESSKRRLYIKTYAVIPLNEECGLIEWIDNLKTLRDILLNLYKQKNIPINYNELRTLLNEASSSPSKTPIFTNRILSKFPPAFHEWFIDQFPEPSAWFAARLRYTRSCAVMSIVGHVLGLGDRHGENILFEETTGGTFHVDFNCLFDKGLTFEKPELVPFRLTHNMVDAFGAYGIDGPFRKSAELTLMILRQHEDTLMTILETFVYDPTTDFIGKKKRSSRELLVPDTPEGVLERVRSKVRGLLAGESVPLGVEGYVQVMVEQARDPWRLCNMYIGWCAFF